MKFYCYYLDKIYPIFFSDFSLKKGINFQLMAQVMYKIFD